MTAAIWRNASGARLRRFVVAQDKRFQERFREVYALPGGEKKKPAKRLPDGANLPPEGWKLIAAQVCEKHGVDWDTLKNKARDRRIGSARNELFYRLHTEARMSYQAIGAKLGGRDHSTVFEGARRHEQRLAEAAL
jgi:hypothetical protein